MPVRRIIWWCNAFDPPSGGAEIWAQHAVRALRARGHDQQVIAITDGPGAGRTGTFEGVGLATIDGAERLSDAAALSAAVTNISNVLADHRPDVILVNNFGHASLAMLGLARSRIEAPIVLLAHNPGLEEAATHGSPLDHSVRRAAAVVAFEPHIAEWVGAHWPAAAIACVDHAIPLGEAAPVPLPGAPRLLFCGRLSEEKGPLVLVEAVARLAKTHPAVHLTIAGSGHQRSEIEARVAALGLDGHVEIAGGVAPDRVNALIDAAFLVCVPSLIEGFGLTALEAAWRGRPVVASRVGGLPGLVADGETGLLVPPGDPAALANAVTLLLDDPTRARSMGEKARARVRTRPGWEQHVAQLEAVIDHVLAGDRNARAALG